jgi:hypothetical protein
MIVEDRAAQTQPTQNTPPPLPVATPMGGFHINTEIDDLVNGHGFSHLMKTFAFMLQHRGGDKENESAFRDLSLCCKAWFGVDIRFKIVDTTGEYQFFGFRFVPSTTYLWNCIDQALSVTSSWESQMGWGTNAAAEKMIMPNTMILCEIDKKVFYDLSNKFTPVDIATMFLYQLEWGLTNTNRIELVTALLKKKITSENMDHRLVEFLKVPPCRNLLMIPYAAAHMYTNFLTKVPASSIASYGNMASRYSDLINKLIGRYGKQNLINRPREELYGTVMNIINWIYEGVNDLKFSTVRFRKNLIDHMKGIASPGMENIMMMVFQSFSKMVTLKYDPLTVQESATMNPEMEAMRDKVMCDMLKEKYERVCEGLNHQFIDDKGFALKVTQQQIDEIRIEVSTISTAEDKIFLLERLYKLIGTIENAMDMLSDRKTSHRVRQSKNELLRMKDECQSVRQMILNTPIGPKRYGLFVQYPAGYEG